MSKPKGKEQVKDLEPQAAEVKGGRKASGSPMDPLINTAGANADPPRPK